jgi:hypothetical protein
MRTSEIVVADSFQSRAVASSSQIAAFGIHLPRALNAREDPNSRTSAANSSPSAPVTVFLPGALNFRRVSLVCDRATNRLGNISGGAGFLKQPSASVAAPHAALTNARGILMLGNLPFFLFRDHRCDLFLPVGSETPGGAL